MSTVIQLGSSGYVIHIYMGDRDWCPCVLFGKRPPTFLGAERFNYIAEQLLNALTKSWEELDGLVPDYCGLSLKWVLTLAEAHSALYVAPDKDNKVLLWKLDEVPEPIIMTLTPEQVAEWQQKLRAFAQEAIERPNIIQRLNG